MQRRKGVLGALDKLGQDTFLGRMQKPRIVASHGVIVTYSFNAPTDPSGILSHLFDPEQTDGKIKEILSVNPSADLKKLEGALGITILDVQLPPKPEESQPPKPRKRILT